MFLADRTIRKLIEAGELGISPFLNRNVQPASVDLTLGDVAAAVYSDMSWLIEPHQFLLASTVERITLPSHIGGTVCGKSTWARRGLVIESAGWCDPGFSGTITLEMFNYSNQNIKLRFGESIAQIIFSFLDVPVEFPYSGRYMGQWGIVAARPEVDTT